MKITIHSVEELLQLVELFGPKTVNIVANRREQMPRARDLAKDETPLGAVVVEDDTPTTDADIAGFDQEDEPDTDRTVVNALTGVDSNGLPWDERIHSNPPKQNADGTWRARRGVDKALVAEVTEELRASPEQRPVAEPQEVEDEPEAPAVTETHPLPTDDSDADQDDEDDALQALLFELVEQARKPAEDIQKDDIATTLGACQAFTKAHSPHTFQLLRETVTPGKTLPTMTPGERRLLLATMELYKP